KQAEAGYKDRQQTKIQEDALEPVLRRIEFFKVLVDKRILKGTFRHQLFPPFSKGGDGLRDSF
ncbi:MAG TPA: hypothetical protein VK518_08670, partial [Puia sp.]|nr:hypothetical protein [Puia sp.]